MTASKLINYLILTFTGAMLTLSMVPIIMPLVTICYITSSLANLLIKIKFGARANRATGYDVLFGMDSVNSYQMINVAIRFSGKLDFNKFRSRLLAMIQNSVDDRGGKRYSRLTKIYSKVFGYAVWMDHDTFDIDQHIELIQLEDLVKQCTREELERQDSRSLNTEYIEEVQTLNASCHGNAGWKTLTKCLLNQFGSKKIRETIPQWQAILLDENSEKYTVLFRFHHSIADGVYLERMLCEGFLDTPVELIHSYKPPPMFKRLMIYLWSFCLLPFGLWTILIENRDRSALHGQQLSGKKKYYLSHPIPLDQLRNIRDRTQGSIYGILLSCLSSAFSKHFCRRSTVEKVITSLIPAPLQNWQKPVVLKNKFAIFPMKIPLQTTTCLFTETSSCSLTRLRVIQNAWNAAKQDPTFWAVHFLITIFCSLLPMKMAAALLSSKGITLTFSSMPGPRTKVCFEKDSIEEIMFWSPDGEPLGIGLSALSYKGQIRIGLALDEAFLRLESEGNQIIRDFENEIKCILRELDDSQKKLCCQNSNEQCLKLIP